MWNDISCDSHRWLWEVAQCERCPLRDARLLHTGVTTVLTASRNPHAIGVTKLPGQCSSDH